MLFVEAWSRFEALISDFLKMQEEHLSIARGALGRAARYCIVSDRDMADRRAAVGMVPADDRSQGKQAGPEQTLVVGTGFAATANREDKIPS